MALGQTSAQHGLFTLFICIWHDFLPLPLSKLLLRRCLSCPSVCTLSCCRTELSSDFACYHGQVQKNQTSWHFAKPSFIKTFTLLGGYPKDATNLSWWTKPFCSARPDQTSASTVYILSFTDTARVT